MINRNKTIKTITKLSARVLLVVFAMHVIGVHAMAESLVYCFETSGDVNIESTTEFDVLFESESDVHEDVSHEHERESVFHQGLDHHKDIPVSLLCASEDKLHRQDQQKTVTDLNRAVYQRSTIASPLCTRQLVVYLPPKIENPVTTNLQTVVLLN